MLAALFLMSPFAANAALIDLGDSTVDTASGLEWLDLTLTTYQSYEDIALNGYGGYAAAGWVHATYGDDTRKGNRMDCGDHRGRLLRELFGPYDNRPGTQHPHSLKSWSCRIGYDPT
jgi:hypothetical protein